MKIHFLGTCAGTEPMPDRRHASLAIESNGALYWFDAGEGCSYTAHLMGLNLLKVRTVVISHTHLDHVGGLCNLLWNIRKLSVVKKRLPDQNKIEVFIPNPETWRGMELILRNTEGNFKKEFTVEASLVKEGLLFEDQNMRVTAFHNSHMSRYESDNSLSFSFSIECEGKKVIYSGDVGQYGDLDEMLIQRCDVLIIETGHFGMDDVYQYVSGKHIGKVCFFHNGREILDHPKEAKEKVERYFGDNAVICEDGMTIIF